VRSRVLAGCRVRYGRERVLRSYSAAPASTTCLVDATSVTRLKTSRYPDATERVDGSRRDESLRPRSRSVHNFVAVKSA